MNQTTTKTAPNSPVRSEAAEAHRSREMPLLFQLADTNRQPAKPTASPAPSALSAVPPGPGPLDMPALPGAFVPGATPLASSAHSSWSHTPKGLFETTPGFSTAALTAGTTVTKSSESLVTSEEKASATESKAPTIEPAPVPAPSVAEAAPIQPEPTASITTLPKAIDEAVKAADITPPAIDKPANEAAEAPAASTVTSTTTTGTSTSTATEATNKPQTDKPAQATTDKPSPGSLRRERAVARQQKVAAKQGNWLQSHGKMIAIGFVIALLGTVYMARRNRPAPEPTPGHDQPMGLAIEVPGESDKHDHDSHDAKSNEAANTAPRLVEAPALPHDTTPSPALADPSRNTPATATAELHPPVMPAPSSTTPPAGNAPLFPWQGENRTATRPDAPTATAPAGGPLATPNAHAPPNGPALTPPAYPETNLRDAPLLPPAPASPPASNPGSGSQPAGGQGRGRAPSGSFPASFTSAPGGTRYERTGSGLY
jgi:hypothetical protein